MNLDAESYLQSGSNELRVLEYTVCGRPFGINILKVRKILARPECLTSTMNSHPSVVGIFKDNDTVIPLIDLGHFLGYEQSEDISSKKVVITEFFNVLNAFLVDSVEWIHHFVWEDVINANDVMKTIEQKYVISIVKPDGERMVPLLDYETIILDLCPELGFKEMHKISKDQFNGEGKRVLVAEDSPSVRNMLVAELMELGFDVVSVCDGKEAVDILDKDKKFDLVISDVEMPQMDGLALTTAIRTNPEIAEMPVIVYSSIGDIGMKTRAEFLKASAHVTKLSIEELMENVMNLTGGTKIVPDIEKLAESKDTESVGTSGTGREPIESQGAAQQAKAITEASTTAITESTNQPEPEKDKDESPITDEQWQEIIAEQSKAESPVESESFDDSQSDERLIENSQASDVVFEANKVTIAMAKQVTIIEAETVDVVHADNLEKDSKTSKQKPGQAAKKTNSKNQRDEKADIALRTNPGSS